MPFVKRTNRRNRRWSVRLGPTFEHRGELITVVQISVKQHVNGFVRVELRRRLENSEMNATERPATLLGLALFGRTPPATLHRAQHLAKLARQVCVTWSDETEH